MDQLARFYVLLRRGGSLKTLWVILGLSLTLIVLAAGLWAWAPDRQRATLEAKYLQPPDARSAADSGAPYYREIAGVRLRVRESGGKTAPVIIFLNGFGATLETWEPWARALSATYRTVRFDYPGTGLSQADPARNYSDARNLEILNGLLTDLGVDRAVLIGNSMGGRIAWKFAATFPHAVTKLVLISPDGFASPGFEYGQAPKVPAILKMMKYFLPKAMLRANLALAYGDPSRLTDARVDLYYDMLLAPGNRDAMIARMQQTILEDPRPALRSINTPTLLLWGAKDGMIPISNAADYLAVLPHATLVTLPALGHVPQEEAPDESLAPVARFLGD